MIKKTLTLLLLILTCGMTYAQQTFEINVPFSKLILQGLMNVELIPSDTARTIVTLSATSQKRFNWTNKADCLTLSLRTGILDKDCTADIKVYYRILDYIGIQGTTLFADEALRQESIKIETLGGVNRFGLEIEATNLDVVISGNSIINLSGSAGEATLKATLGSTLNCLKMTIAKAEVVATEGSEMYLDVTDALDARATINANIFYREGPELKAKTTLGGAIVQIPLVVSQ